MIGTETLHTSESFCHLDHMVSSIQSTVMVVYSRHKSEQSSENCHSIERNVDAGVTGVGHDAHVDR